MLFTTVFLHQKIQLLSISQHLLECIFFKNIEDSMFLVLIYSSFIQLNKTTMQHIQCFP